MPTYDKDGHLLGDTYFNVDYFHVGNETAEKTYINIENQEVEIHELKAPTNDNDAATKKYVDDNTGGGDSVFYTLTKDAQDFPTLQQMLSDYTDGKIPIIKQNGILVSNCIPVTHFDTGNVMGLQWTAITTVNSVGDPTAATNLLLQLTLQNSTLDGMEPSAEYDPTQDSWVDGTYILDVTPFPGQ